MRPEEFNKKMAPLRAKLLRQARQMSEDDATAEDLVQETLIALWQMRDRLDSHPNHEALAMAILRNKWNDEWRRRKRTISDETLLSHSGAPPESHDDLELIEFIVGQLPPLQQQIFRLKEIEGYEKDEIIQITGCTDESLRQNLSRARRRIREQYIKMTAQ